MTFIISLTKLCYFNAAIAMIAKILGKFLLHYILGITVLEGEFITPLLASAPVSGVLD